MRAVWVAVAAVFLSVGELAIAQEPLPPTPPLPPSAPGPAEVPSLPNGTAVSRPLTPVETFPDLNPNPTPFIIEEGPVEIIETTEPVARVEEIQKPKYTRKGPLGRSWDSMELLIWWPKAHPVPPLITATRTGAPPVLSDPNTMLLLGNRAISNPDFAGGRFTLGWAVNKAETVGFELVYFFLGSRTQRALTNGILNPRVQAVGVPYTDAVTGDAAAFPNTAPGVALGSIYATTTTRMQGAEANAVANLFDWDRVRVNGIVGYRFLQVHEGLTVEQFRMANGTTGTIYDEFVAHNRFNGGQIGLHADIGFGAVFCELTGKVAFGRTFEVVRIDGATAIDGGFVPGGVLALPSNIGRFTRSTFAVVPEATIKFGVKLSEKGRFFVGYNFLYLSNVVRPGDQIDTTVNAANIPSLGGGFNLPDRPQPRFDRTDFWAQGLIFGLETRY